MNRDDEKAMQPVDNRDTVDDAQRKGVAAGGRQRPRSRRRHVPPVAALPAEQCAAIGTAARTIAGRLQERRHEARIQIFRIVRWCGEERTFAWLAEAERLDTLGGELVASRQRRRTCGGIFFDLAKREMTARQCALIWPPRDERASVAADTESHRSCADRTGLDCHAQRQPHSIPANTWRWRRHSRPTEGGLLR